jgi:peptidyl-prolyl cis-trans isomerase D
MTMLDRMRQHKGWLKWSLAIVILAFIVLYVPQFLSPTGVGAAPTDTIATVEGREIKAGTYQRLYNVQLSQLRSAYGELDEQMVRQLGLGYQLVEQLINQEAVLAEADRLDITVSNGELRARLVRLPMFQENGQFIGATRYGQVLDMQRPPTRPAEFEQQLRHALIAEKLEAAVTGWIRVSDEDVAREYRRRHERVKADLALFPVEQFRAGITPTDEEIAARYNASPEAYRVPEKRRVRYIAVAASDLAPRMTVTPAEVEARYRQNIQAFSTPEQVEASHILFKTENKDPAEVRKTADGVLARVKSGADFAALAKQYTEDEGSKEAGGALGYFGRGSMVKEFEDAAFGLQPGQVSDLVETQFGFHVIKVTGRREATTRSLDEARQQIEAELRSEKAQSEANRLADVVAGAVDEPGDLDTVAAEQKLIVGDSGLFSREEPLAGIGFAPAVAAEAFRLTEGQVSEKLITNDGFAVIALVQVQPSVVPALEAVTDQVRNDVILSKAREAAVARAVTLAASTGNFAAAAKAAGGRIVSSDLVARGSTLPEVGVNQKLEDALFAAKPGELTAPVTTPTTVVVGRVVERQDIDSAALAAERETVREELTRRRRGEFFAAYMEKAKTDMRVERNESVIAELMQTP